MEHGANEVLVVGTDDWAIGDAANQLLAAGRVVHRCSESSDIPFPCNALMPGQGCPLDRHQVDVVLNVRRRSGAPAGLSEMGAICGLRAGVPLVVAGVADTSGFARWAEQVPARGDVVTSCDQAVEARAHQTMSGS